MVIPGIPYRRFFIDSQIDADKFQTRLKLITSSKRLWFKQLKEEYKFIGKISNNSFRLLPNIKGRNTYLPRILGNVTPSTNGCKISVALTLHPIAIILVLAFFVFGEYLAFSKEGHFNMFFALLLFVFHLVMYFIGFLPQSKRVESIIKGIAEK